jgi:hypothetical protein
VDSNKAYRSYQAKQECSFANASNDEDTADSDICVSNSVQRQEKTSAPALPDDNQERTSEKPSERPYSRRKRTPTFRQQFVRVPRHRVPMKNCESQ